MGQRALPIASTQERSQRAGNVRGLTSDVIFKGLEIVELRRCDDTGYRFYPRSVAGEASWMGVETELHHHRRSEQVKIVAAIPFALPFAIAELAITGRTKAENIAMVFRKRQSAGNRRLTGASRQAS